MKLTSRGRYSLRAMLDLVSNLQGNPVRLREISNRQGISLHYLEQLFRRLRTGQVVKSVRGPGGGYLLAKEANLITIKDILDSVGESTSFADQIDTSPKQKTQEHTIVSNLLGNELDTIVIDFLKSKTLQDLSDQLKNNT